MRWRPGSCWAACPSRLVDTAGLRKSFDSIEAEGVRRALARAAEADLAMTVIEAGSPAPGRPRPSDHRQQGRPRGAGPEGALRISAKTGLGMDELRARLAAIARQMTEVERPPAADPSTASRGAAGGGGASGGCGTGRFAGIAGRRPAAGNAGTGADYRVMSGWRTFWTRCFRVSALGNRTGGASCQRGQLVQGFRETKHIWRFTHLVAASDQGDPLDRS